MTRTYEWGIESASGRSETADGTRCGHRHVTVEAAYGCLASATRRMTAGGATGHRIRDAILARSDGTALDSDELDDLRIATT